MSIKCKKCGYIPINQSELSLHHVIPKFLGGTDKDGRFYLCEYNKGNDCHKKLHLFLKPIIKKYTYEWLEKEGLDDRNTKTIMECKF